MVFAVLLLQDYLLAIIYLIYFPPALAVYLLVTEPSTLAEGLHI